MKRIDVLKLIGLNLLVILMIVSPFIPGPSNKLVGIFSFAGQLTGIAGLFLVPLGLAWILIGSGKSGKSKISQQAQYQLAIAVILLIALVFLLGVVLLPNPMPKLTSFFGLLLLLSGLAVAQTYIRKWKDKKEEILGRAAAILLAASATACITFIYIFTLLFVFVMVGIIPGIIGLLLLPAGLKLAAKQIRKLKEPNEEKINRTPLYLLTVPVVAFITFLFIVKPASKFSRNYAIQRSETLIFSIENHKNKTGKYPESIQELYAHSTQKMPKPFIMGIENYRYNKINDYYSISFSQWLDLGSLEEIALFEKGNLKDNLSGQYAKYDYTLDLCRIRGAFAGHDTGYDNWRYYHSD